jgi:fructosamine-3-kinase
MKKYLSTNEVSRIIEIYREFKINYLPKIISYNLEEGNSFIDFEWLEGTPIDDDNLTEAFYQLGIMHKQCKTEDTESGFITICHGDFHKKNIIHNAKGIFFVDVTYIHKGWNYSDLCYLDFYDLFPEEKYPWYIKNPGCFETYLNGLEVNYDEQKKNYIKKEITNYLLNYSINNGLKRGINVDFESDLLKKLQIF